MAITKQKKSEILAKLQKEVVTAPSIVFTAFRGVPVNSTTAFRKKLKAAGANYYVAKKTLIKKAFAETSIAGTMPELIGEVALTYSADLLTPAKSVAEFAKQNPDKIQIIGGVFEGVYMSAVEMKAIAAIPSREVLYGQFVNVINSPIQGLVIALDAIAKKKGE